MTSQTQKHKYQNQLCSIDSIIESIEDTKILDAIKAQKVDKIDEYEQQKCTTCNVDMDKYHDEHSVVCPKCGVTIMIGNCGEYTMMAGEGHNTSSNAYMPLKPIGVRHKLYYNTMIKYTSENETFSQAQIYKTFEHVDFINPDFHIPKPILRAAADLFIILRKNKFVKRSDARRGLIGACIGKECERAGITKTDTQLAKMLKISETHISTGREELQIFHNQHIIDIPQNRDPIPDLINSYFEDFKIEEKYKTFSLALLERINKKKIMEIETSYATTKCIGILYIINYLLDLDITHEQIALKCNNISRGTYLNIFNVVRDNEKALRKVFIRHKMPVFPSWKQS